MDNEESSQTGGRRKEDNDNVRVTSPTERSRPEFRCTTCDQLFPSQLDLSEHVKIDHQKKASVSA
ncbi:MAG TPA: hypothetical protein VJP79_09640 [Nitrososphaera sp.]|nr:hypothetical protein [Nitrososphaera sp.]